VWYIEKTLDMINFTGLNGVLVSSTVFKTA
jgi:hypothetical protein